MILRSVYHSRGIYCLFFICILAALPREAIAKRVHNRHYKFAFKTPDSMVEIGHTPDSAAGMLYYGIDTGVSLTIFARDGKFKSVHDYLDCSREELEQILKAAYGDSTFHLINCCESKYYPEKTTVLYFQVASNNLDDMNLIYFIHHRKKDIQLYFTFSRKHEVSSLKYIDAVMQSLKLR